MSEDINAQIIEALEQINEAINVLYKDIDERLKLIEARLASPPCEPLPIPWRAGMIECEPAGMDYAETKAWDAAADEALRNFEKECGG